ncbi:MAG: type II secretion system protein [Dehalococcoidia bacterium]|nr:MAG: type II secretion system protein [Dehalococcoidia bacterium]
MPRQMNIAAPLFRVAKKFKGNEAGFSLVETLVALAILGSIAVVFLSGLATAAKATFIADERATAESITRSQIEYVQSQDYIDYSVLDHEEYEELALDVDSVYSIELTAAPIDPDTGQPLPSDQDDGMQKITVTVQRGEKSVLTVEDYKVDR